MERRLFIFCLLFAGNRIKEQHYLSRPDACQEVDRSRSDKEEVSFGTKTLILPRISLSAGLIRRWTFSCIMNITRPLNDNLSSCRVEVK